MNMCKRCNKYLAFVGERCTCDRYEITRDNDDPDTVYATSIESAVERWAAEDDWSSADFEIVKGNDAVVNVLCPNGETKRVRVSGEAQPVYTATVLKPVAPPGKDGGE